MTDTNSNIWFERAEMSTAGEVARLSPLIRRVVAPNASPFTYTGTCTYIVGNGHVAVIDPGPDDATHVAALLAALRGETVDFIVATHTHRDHSPATRALKEATGAKIIGCRAPTPRPQPESGRGESTDTSYVPDQVMVEGDVLEANGFTLAAIATPGHASNHLCYALPAEETLFSGDHVMAWSTTIVSPPDGSIADYMASLEKLRRRQEDKIYWPGHGGPVAQPQRYVKALELHRRQREAAIVARLAAGDSTIDAIVERLYEHLDPRLKRGAARFVLAHLEDLIARGRVATDGPATMEGDYRLVS